MSKSRQTRRNKRRPAQTEWTPATSLPGEIYAPTGKARSSRAFFLGLRNKRRILALDKGGFSSALISGLVLVVGAFLVFSALLWLLGA